jgi:hypothetical protein
MVTFFATYMCAYCTNFVALTKCHVQQLIAFLANYQVTVALSIVRQPFKLALADYDE